MFLNLLFNKRYVAYKKYDQHAVIFQEIAKRLVERLSIIKLEPATVLEIGADIGYTAILLTKQRSKAKLIVIEQNEQALQYAQQKKRLAKTVEQLALNINIETIPLAAHSVDLIVASVLPRWCENLPRLLSEVKRVLKPGGLFFFSSLGPDTLKELPNYLTQPANLIQDKLIDMHNIGDELMQLGFAEPVMEMEMLQLSYSNSDKLVKELQILELADKNAKAKAAGDNLLLSFEVIYGHAWQAEIQQKSESGEIYVSLDKIKKPSNKKS